MEDNESCFNGSLDSASLSEADIAEAFHQYGGVITRQSLQDGRHVKSHRVETGEQASDSSPRRRRFYTMVTGSDGQEKALDSLWVDKLQELLDEAARAYGTKNNEWQDDARIQEQHELKMEIRNKFTNFFQNGSESIDSVMAQLNQVWKGMSSPEKSAGVDVPQDLGDLQESLASVGQLLQEAREKGCAQADKVTRQWFAFISQEVFNVEKFGNVEVKDLDHLKHRLNLLHMYHDLDERWHRMDALNAGLEEAVQSKAALQSSVDSAELLLVKQVRDRKKHPAKNYICCVPPLVESMPHSQHMNAYEYCNVGSTLYDFCILYIYIFVCIGCYVPVSFARADAVTGSQ